MDDTTRQQIRKNVKAILTELPDAVELVAAAKTRSPEEIQEAVQSGVKIVGTKRVSAKGQVSGLTEYAGNDVMIILVPKEGSAIKPTQEVMYLHLFVYSTVVVRYLSSKLKLIRTWEPKGEGENISIGYLL